VSATFTEELGLKVCGGKFGHVIKLSCVMFMLFVAVVADNID